LDKNRTLKAGIGYIIGNYLIKGLAFFTLPIFARIMSVEDLGLYNTFIAYEGILLYLIGIGYDTSFKNARYRYGISEENEKASLCYEEYTTTVLCSIFINALVWLVLLIVFRNSAQQLLALDYQSIFMLILFSLSSAVILCYNANASLNYNYKGYIKIGLVNAVGSVLLSLFLILKIFPQKAYWGRMLGSTAIITGIAIFILVLFFKRHRPGHVKEYLRWGLRFSLPIVPHGIGQVILVQFDRIMINRMVGSYAAGIYGFAYSIFSIVYVTYRSLDPVWSTWFFERMNADDTESVKKYSSLYIVGVLIFSSLVILVSPELVLLLGSSKYIESVYCVIPIVAGGYFCFLYSVPCQVEYYKEKTQHIAIATFCAAAINVILNIIFIRLYGYVAAAYTTLVTYMIYFLIHYLIAKRIEKRSIFSTPVFISCSLAILGISGIAMLLLDHRVIRYIIVIIMLGFLAFFGMRYYKQFLQFKRR
jgi:O-antigen/teichoic acid export membrane protein